MQGHAELIQKLRKLKAIGYVRTHRAGNTGIGKTLEDILGIKENNVPGPNGMMLELKSARKNAKSMLTLFTKSPEPKKANSVLLQKYGYLSRKGNNKKELHTTVNALEYNTLKGKIGFKIRANENAIELISKSGEVLGYWEKGTLKERFETKLPRLLYVKADCRGKGAREEFFFNEAMLLSGFSFENFLELVKEGTILVDVRIGQYPDGRPHDHGTGFRVFPDKLELCFSQRKRIL